MKKAIAVTLVLAMLFIFSNPVYAAAEPSISPNYTNATQAKVTLVIDPTGSAELNVVCIGKSDVSSISATTYLERKIGNLWARVDIGTSTDSWNCSTPSVRLAKSYTTTLSESGEYRAVTVFTLVGKTTETITVISSASY